MLKYIHAVDTKVDTMGIRIQGMYTSHDYQPIIFENIAYTLHRVWVCIPIGIQLIIHRKCALSKPVHAVHY